MTLSVIGIFFTHKKFHIAKINSINNFNSEDNPNGIHARPAGMLVKECAKYNCSITIDGNGKTADAKKIFAVMGLGVRSGDTITLTFDGSDEAEAKAHISEFIGKNL